MWGFHLIMSPLPMIAPKVKLSQGDKKQSKKQFAWLTISSLPRGVVVDICALEGARSQPLPKVCCSGAGIQGLWCFSSGLWWQLKIHGAASQGKQDLHTLEGAAHHLWLCRLHLGNPNPCSCLPPSFSPVLKGSLGNASFWWEQQASVLQTTEGLREEFIKHTCILLYLITFFSGQIMALSLVFQGLIGN